VRERSGSVHADRRPKDWRGLVSPSLGIPKMVGYTRNQANFGQAFARSLAG